ncbi:MAG: alpha/beta hydrolase [Gammaproteobacteria bacterium]
MPSVSDREPIYLREYRAFELIPVIARDGFALRVWESGPAAAPRVVIVNPIGVPLVIGARLARELAESHRVICFEQRGYLAYPGEFETRPHDFSVFVSDLVHVVSQRADSSCTLIGICTGAAQAVRAIAGGALSVANLVLVSPLVRLSEGYSPSLFDRGMVPYLNAIAKGDEKIAGEMLAMRAASRQQIRVPPPSDDEIMVDAADTASLDTLASLSRYARTVRDFAAERFDEDLRKVAQPVLVVCAEDDKTVSINSVRTLCALLPAAELKVLAKGGHYLLYVSDEARQLIRGWLPA